jgi:poly(3-hydroxybutyrate) depolymerase
VWSRTLDEHHEFIMTSRGGQSVPLVEESPEELDEDPCEAHTLTFTSKIDGETQCADVYSPAVMGEEPLPLVIAPHPITWTAEEDYHGGLEGLMRGYHRGWYGLADKYDVIIVMPHGHHSRVELCSLASPEQISDLAQLPSELEENGFHIDHQRLYACGLSMGAQEALVLAGKHPEFLAATFVFNPIVDLAQWQQDLAETAVEEIREYGTAEKIAEEVGGVPEDVPELYAERSPIVHIDGLSQVPTMVYWSHQDLIVPNQKTRHALLLCQRVKSKDALAPFAEYNHTIIHGVTDYSKNVRWQLHEWSDYELALRWMLNHQRDDTVGS